MVLLDPLGEADDIGTWRLNGEATLLFIAPSFDSQTTTNGKKAIRGISDAAFSYSSRGCHDADG